jgi:integrase
MASINVRKQTGKLYLDFRHRGVRCREQTNFIDTPANRKKLQKLLDRIEAEIMLGIFDYAETFPNSKRLEKINHTNALIAAESSAIPTIGSFCDLWLEESKVQWGASYTRSVTYIIEKRIKPFFGDMEVSKISKQQVLAFRNEIVEIKKKDGTTISYTHESPFKGT